MSNLEDARKGGRNRRATGAPLAGRLDPTVLAQLEQHPTAGVLVTVLGSTVAGLLALPLDVRVANALAQLCTAAARLIETDSLEQRIMALEQRAPQAPPVRANGRPLPGVPREG